MAKSGRPLTCSVVQNVEIYALCEPGTDIVRYIGKAKCAQKRLMTHIRESRRRSRPVNLWVRKVCASGNVPSVVILRVVPVEVWEDEERKIIAEYRQKYSNLLNVADGGSMPKSDPKKSSVRIKLVVEQRHKSIMRVYRIIEYYVSMSRRLFPHRTERYLAVKETWRAAVMVARANGKMDILEQKAGGFLAAHSR